MAEGPLAKKKKLRQPQLSANAEELVEIDSSLSTIELRQPPWVKTLVSYFKFEGKGTDDRVTMTCTLAHENKCKTGEIRPVTVTDKGITSFVRHLEVNTFFTLLNVYALNNWIIN
jgi:hypothetical protein